MRLAPSCLCLSFVAGCAAPPGPGGDGSVAAAIAAAWQAHFAAARAGDAVAASSLYADDATYVVPGAIEARGKAALLAMEQAAARTTTIGAVQHTTHALRVDGDAAHELGTVRGDVASAGAPMRLVVFDYAATWWRDRTGAWRIGWLHGRFPSAGQARAGDGAIPEGDIDLRPQFAALGLPPRGQGPRPTCSIFATTTVLEFAYARATGTGTRLSAEYRNWAANAATGRGDDGDFFHFALQGYERFGICSEALWPYAAAFPATAPDADALVDAGRRAATAGTALRSRWLRPIDGKPGLSPAQFADVLATLRRGWPVAVGAAHSRVLVGYHADAAAPGGGTFFTIDSGHGVFAEVTAAYVMAETCDAFTVEPAAD